MLQPPLSLAQRGQVWQHCGAGDMNCSLQPGLCQAQEQHVDLDHSRASALWRGFLTGCSSFLAVPMQQSFKSDTDKSLLCACYSHWWECSSWEVPSTSGPAKANPKVSVVSAGGTERDDVRILLSLWCRYWSGLECHPPSLQLCK